MIHIAPSILAADFSRLGDEVAAVEAAGANRIHVDVMDGHFVPNLSMGPAVVQSLRPRTKLPLEVHLMVSDPGRFVESFIKAGADSLIVHQEVLPDPRPLLGEIRRRGKKAGLSIKPETAIEAIQPFLADLDLALCMTVEPGFGGQKFLPDSCPRIRRLRALIDKLNPACELEVDGGIDHDTGPQAVEAGANVLVMGTAVFRYPGGAAEAMRAILRSAQSNRG